MNGPTELLRRVRFELPSWREEAAGNTTRVWRHSQGAVIALNVVDGTRPNRCARSRGDQTAIRKWHFDNRPLRTIMGAGPVRR